MIKGSQTTLRHATDDDVPRLVGWHADPEVSRFWDGKIYTEETMRARLRRPHVVPWIIEADGEPVGYVQAWWEEDDPSTVGLDGFLAPAARGRGLMPDAARALAQALLAEGRGCVTVDPYAWNARALRGWAKAGFVEVSRHPPDGDHTAEWVLMRFRE